MLFDSLHNIAAGVFNAYAKQAPVIACLIVFFSAWTILESQHASPGKAWWRNKDLPVDVAFGLLNILIGPYLMVPTLLVFMILLSGVMTAQETMDYFAGGRGPLSALPFWWQLAVYVVVSDFMVYWAHRIFHTAHMWRFHATHHSAEELDWTTSYRFHPVDLAFEHLSVTVIMVMLGIAPAVVQFFAPAAAFIAAWQHSNTKWTFGPLKYVLVTPLMHRWHHTQPGEGGNANFGRYFALWDCLFGTFYMPAGQVPWKFGVDDENFPKDQFTGQLLYPVRLDSGRPAALNGGETGQVS